MWTPQTNLSQDLSSNGIVKLWASPNYFNDQNWRTEGVFGVDLFYYFFIPYPYFYSDAIFYFDAPFKFEEKELRVTTKDPEHDGEQKTEKFWNLIPSSSPQVELQTDVKTKLPYLTSPDLGQPDYVAVKTYLIPVGVNT